MILQDFMQMFIEPELQKIEIFDLKSSTIIFVGEYRDLSNNDLDYCEVISIDTLFRKTDVITINVEL